MEKKLTSRDKQAIATRKKIYRVGIKLIQKHGIDGVGVSQIAKAAGVSVGTFYHYYKSKLDLFMDLYRQADAFYENELAQQAASLPFADKLQLFFREYVALAENNGVPLTQKMYVADNSLFISGSTGMHRVLDALIAEAQASGECTSDLDPEEISAELFIIARGVVFDWALHEGNYDIKEKMSKLLGIYLQSII